MKFSSRELYLKIKSLDPPECECKVEKRPFCVDRSSPQGCRQRKETGDCDCPYFPGEPCRHILEQSIPFDINGLTRFMEAAFSKLVSFNRDDFAKPKENPEPMIAFDRETRVALMAKRVQEGYVPFSSEDRIEMPQSSGKRISTYKNGRLRHDEDITKDYDDSHQT